MYVIAVFEHSLYLELAITSLEKRGVLKESILAVPLAKRTTQAKVFDTIHRADGVSLFDGAAILSTVFMVLGTIYGFIWHWGPIVWALIGLLFGATLGFVLDLLFSKRRRHEKYQLRQKSTAEVVLIINCTKDQVKTVEEDLWDNLALGVAKLDR